MYGLLAGSAFVAAASGLAIAPRQANDTSCPGYSASNVQQTGTGLSADLSLAGSPCNSYGNDIENLRLTVNYDTNKRLHVKIEDSPGIAYQVPTEIFPTPNTDDSVSADDSDLDFSWEESPFSFKVTRKSNEEVLFDSSAASLVFQDQYLRLRTALPEHPNLYGLGEHTDGFRLNTTDYVRTFWNRDSYGIPTGTNLYGSHPVYFEHRGEAGTHGVFLLSSSGMDIKIDVEDGQQYLEYNVLGGVIDLYIMAGETPTDVSKQYAEVAGLPAMMPYWGFGLHQCRYGYRDFYAVAEVVTNYSAANIPLETMWTDIDYMYERYIMTLDPDRFPLERMRDIVDYLHEHDQHYVVMVDPAVAYQEQKYDNLTYDTFTTARDEGLFVYKNGSIFRGVVWPGVTAFPDWFHPDIQEYWDNEFLSFFDADSGLDIDALWIDMNEAANFNYYNDDPDETAEDRGFPPPRPELRSQPREIPGFPPEFQPGAAPYPPDDFVYAPPWLASDAAPNTKKRALPEGSPLQKRQEAEVIGYPDRDFLNPPYTIDNENTVEPLGGLSNFTLDTDIVHYDGHVELDVHNLYGTMMSTASRKAMLARRPGRRPLVVTRSTFAGAGKDVSKWLGDNLSTWEQYRFQIQQMLDFAAFFQMPMVGSDICGFGGNTTETLCARWATLGAFNPFSRNHNGDTSNPQEFYLWETVASAARNAYDIRYRLLDYIYTALHEQTVDGTPLLNPLYFKYPYDPNTFGIAHQFFYGHDLLVSPVTEENSTSVTLYLPDARFYAFDTWEVVEGAGAEITLDDVALTDIPLHVRGGAVIPLRAESGLTTTAVREKPFHLIVAPDRDGKASGKLYLDDGDSVEQEATSEIEFEYADGVLTVSGSFDYTAEDARVSAVKFLGSKEPEGKPKYGKKGGERKTCGDEDWSYEDGVVTVEMDQKLDGEFTVEI